MIPWWAVGLWGMRSALRGTGDPGQSQATDMKLADLIESVEAHVVRINVACQLKTMDMVIVCFYEHEGCSKPESRAQKGTRLSLWPSDEVSRFIDTPMLHPFQQQAD